MLKDFKDFAMKGNVVDMAVGIVIGAAFGTVIKSLVSDILMPPVGLLLGGVDFSNIFSIIKGEGDFATLAAAQDAGVVTVNWGIFINAIISFIIVAFALFLVIKAVNKAKAMSEEEKAAAPVVPPKQEVLLTEIRDLLKKK